MTEGLLAGKVIVITGVGSGLGREIAARCVGDGADIVIGARTEAQLHEVAGEVDPSGAHVAVVPTDINDEAACARIVAAAEERFGRVDGLAQVAAYEYSFGGLFDTDFDAARQSWETNVIGTWKILRPTVEAMRRADGGSIALIGSQSMWTTMVQQMGYGASKSALAASVRYLVGELGPDHIRVNTVVPSWMWGPPVQMYVDMQADARQIPKERVVDEITSGIPLGEIVADEDVANAVAFFLSDRARMITGQSLLVNGGELMR